MKTDSPRQQPFKASVKPETDEVTILLSDSDDGLPQPKRQKPSPELGDVKQEESKPKLENGEDPQQSALKSGMARASYMWTLWQRLVTCTDLLQIKSSIYPTMIVTMVSEVFRQNLGAYGLHSNDISAFFSWRCRRNREAYSENRVRFRAHAPASL